MWRKKWRPYRPTRRSRPDGPRPSGAHRPRKGSEGAACRDNCAAYCGRGCVRRRDAPPGIEPDRRALVASIADLEDADAGAIIDGRELIEARARAWNALEELHVHPQSMTRLRLLVPLPPLGV